MFYKLPKKLAILLMMFTFINSLEFLEDSQINLRLNEINEEKHCVSIGGKVENMIAQIDTHNGLVNGLERKFCLYKNKLNNLAILGLDTLGSTKPNFAATFLLKIKIAKHKTIPGKKGLISMNLCNKLKGTMISFLSNGGFYEKGQGDICFFGDGSSISAWTLYYLGIGGIFDNLKNEVLSKPLDIDIPNLYK